MRKWLPTALVLLCLSATLPGLAQAGCVKRQIACKTVTLQPSGQAVAVALAKKPLDSKRSGSFRLKLTLFTVDAAGTRTVVTSLESAEGFKLSSKVKKFRVKSADDDTATVTFTFFVTPSVGSVNYRYEATASSLTDLDPVSCASKILC